jgi:hypothetical protein
MNKVYGIVSYLIIWFLLALVIVFIHIKPTTANILQILGVWVVITLFFLNIIVISRKQIKLYGFFPIVTKKYRIDIVNIKRILVNERNIGKGSSTSITFFDANDNKIGEFLSLLLFFERRNFIKNMRSLNIEVGFNP